MLTTLLLGTDDGGRFAFETVALVLFYVALAWLPLRLIRAAVGASRRRRARHALGPAVEHDDGYRVGMKILPPM